MNIDKVSNNNLIGFNDEYHKYFFIDEARRKEKFKSVTQFTKSLEPEFKLEEKSLKKSIELDVTQDKVKSMWESHRIKSADDGTYVHGILEHLAVFKMPVTLDRWHPKLNGAFQFYTDYLDNKKYRLISCEEILYFLDEDTGTYFAGQRDLALEEISTGRILSIDYKTNDIIRTEGFYDKDTKAREKLRGTFSYLESCSLNTYTVQLNLYKLFDVTNNEVSREKANDKLYDMYICHITPTGYNMIKVNDINVKYCKEAKEFISDTNKLNKEESIKRFLLN